MKVWDGITELYDRFMDFHWGIGYFGWQIATMYCLQVVFLVNINYAVLFVLLFLLSGWLNHAVFKDWIHDLRPSNGRQFLVTDVIKKGAYGMPSGHAQQTAFALTIAYLFTGHHLLTSLWLFGLTVAQRYAYRNHTLSQLAAGGAVGVVLGITAVYVMRYAESKMVRAEKSAVDGVQHLANNVTQNM